MATFDLNRARVKATMDRYINLVLNCTNTAESYWHAMRDQVTENYSIYADENERRLKAVSSGSKTRRNVLRSRLATLLKKGSPKPLPVNKNRPRGVPRRATHNA